MSKSHDESSDRQRRGGPKRQHSRGRPQRDDRSPRGERGRHGERSGRGQVKRWDDSRSDPRGDRSRGGRDFRRDDRRDDRRDSRRDDRRDDRGGRKRWDDQRSDRRGGARGDQRGDARGDRRGNWRDDRRDDRRDSRRDDRKNRPEREGTRRERRHEPPIPDGITGTELHSEARRQLRPLEKANAEVVAKHLVAAGQLIDTSPEAAYAHAQAALGRAARIGAVREAVGIVAYQLENYGEALRELRTHRRITGSNDNVALMADCERGRGNPKKALEVAREFDAVDLDPAVRIELLIVTAGAYSDLGDNEKAKAVLSSLGFTGHPAGATVRLLSAYADLLRVEGETELADKYEELARRTAKMKNVMYGDEEPDPNADVEIMTITELPDDPEEPGDPEKSEAQTAAAESVTDAESAADADSGAGAAPEADAPTEAPAAATSFEAEVEAEVDEILAEAGLDTEGQATADAQTATEEKTATEEQTTAEPDEEPKQPEPPKQPEQPEPPKQPEQPEREGESEEEPPQEETLF